MLFLPKDNKVLKFERKSIPKRVLFRCAMAQIRYMTKRLRADHTGAARNAYEKNKSRLLKTAPRICGICGQPIDFNYKYPHPLSPTVDHIIPLNKGGHPYDMDNLQLAHNWCNRWKSDRVGAGVKFVLREQVEEINKKSLPQHYDWSNYVPL